MKSKLMAIVVAISLLTSTLAIIPFAAAVPLTKVKVEPAESHFWSDVDSVGKAFTISIIAEDIIDQLGGMFGWEFILSWDAGKIDCTGETLNYAFWPANSGPLISSPIDNAAGTYHQSLAARAPSTPVTGTFWLVNVTFQIVAPAPYMGVVSTALTLGPGGGLVYLLIDNTASEIPHEFVNGGYYYHWAPPTSKPYLAVEPTSYTARNVGEEFDINVRIHNVDAGWRLAGTQFLLTYNTSMLDVLSVTQGDFLDAFTTDTFFFGAISEGYVFVRVAYAILNITGMTPPYTPPPSPYTDIVATIRFNATAQGEFPTELSCGLLLAIDTDQGMNSYFVNYLSEELEYVDAINGTYKMQPKITGRMIDVFTQYPFPYGGQGINANSDMFWPQKEVILNASVTYNEWPVQNKPVSFEVRAPDNTLMAVLTGVSNNNSFAVVSFRMNWPCDDPEELFGEWTVIASVDIACEVVNDTLHFKYDYLVHWVKVTTDMTDYVHCNTTEVTIEFQSYAMQTYQVVIAVTIKDELDYTVVTGTVLYDVTVGGAIYCHYENYTANASIRIDKSVVAGTATIHVSALSDLPSHRGTAYCPEYAPAPEIRILAQ